MASYDEDEEKPLDPAAEKLRRRLARLQLVSGGIMLLGFIAVFASIVYKVNEGANDLGSGKTPIEATLEIPAGYRIVGTALDGDRALLTLAAPDGSTMLVVFDLTSGRTLGRYSARPPE